MSHSKQIFGIDLGTTNACVSVVENNRVKCIRVNGRDTWCIVCYDIQDGTPQIDRCAIQSSIKSNIKKTLSGIKNCTYDVKRFIGCSYSDPRIQKIYKKYPFEVAESEDGQVEFRLQCADGPLSKSPQQVISEILKYLKITANNYIKHDAEEEIEAVITVPTYFDISQRKATIEAANLAGIKVLKLLNEPTASALYHLYTSEITDTTLLIFDFGGGTLDISIIEVDSSKNVTVVATAGDPLLGGRDIDNNIFQYMQNEIIQELNERLTRRLRKDVEEIKTLLTECSSASSEALKEIDIDLEITIDIFNRINKDIFERCMTLAKECLKQANKKPEDIKEVLLAGGSSIIPKLESLIQEYFSNSKIVKSQDRTEIVCYGAALQASMIKENIEFKLNIFDTINISLGYNACGEEMIFIFKKQSKIPITVDHEVATMTKNQNKIVIKIYEGERKYIKYNNFLGSLTLDKLPSNSAGFTFKIKFTINESGILEVAVKHEDHAKSINIDLYTSKPHERKNIMEKGIQREDLDRDFVQFNQIKTLVCLCCNEYIIKPITPMSDLEKIKLMRLEIQRCNFEQLNVETLRAIIIHHIQGIYSIQFRKVINRLIDENHLNQ